MMFFVGELFLLK